MKNLKTAFYTLAASIFVTAVVKAMIVAEGFASAAAR